MSESNKLLIGISGSIAAYKIAFVISHFKKRGWDIRVIATPSALEFVGAATLEGLCGSPVIDDDFTSGRMMSHIDLARWADVFLIAPATANTLNSLAYGVGNNILNSTYLAYEQKKPLLIAPAMNTQMLLHPTVQNSLKILEKNGAHILPTENGLLACGEVGSGKLLDPEQIIFAVDKALIAKNPKFNILLTLGGTRVPIDSVRSITNTSTGATGSLLADALIRAGYSLTVLAAKNAQTPKLVEDLFFFDTYEDLETLLEKQIKEKKFSHIIQMAAISDFTVDYTSHKLSSKEKLNIALTPTKKLISKIRKWSPKTFLVGFKLTAGASKQEVDLAIQSVFSHGANAVIHNDLFKISSDQHPMHLYNEQGFLRSVDKKQDLALLIISLLNDTLKNIKKSNEVSYDSLS